MFKKQRAIIIFTLVVMLTMSIGNIFAIASEEDGSNSEPVVVQEASNEAPVEKPAAPAKEAAPPAAETAAPAKETAAPVKETAPPAAETAAPAKETAAPVKETAAPAKETAAPVKETAAPAKETAAPNPAPESPAEEKKDSTEPAPVSQEQPEPEPEAEPTAKIEPSAEAIPAAEKAVEESEAEAAAQAVEEVEAVEEAAAVKRSVSIEISGDPSSFKLGDQVVLKAKLKGYDGVQYEITWEYSEDGKVWHRAPGVSDQLTYTFTIDKENASWHWRVSVDAYETIEDDDVPLGIGNNSGGQGTLIALLAAFIGCGGALFLRYKKAQEAQYKAE